MTFISYAQNFEDVMLFRALKGIRNGFYIDVGAQDPVFDSVTKAFYELGWRGISIEPVEQWIRRLVADRPEDTNLQIAAWSQTGSVRFFEVRDTGMSTVKEDFARRHTADGFEVRSYEIPAKPLDDICAELGVKEVHFLKVDVEGAEGEVLRGISLTEIRPWIILVEATEPNSQVATHEKWEHLLTSRRYEFVYFDGLSRFYIALEHAGLKSAFSTPPNYFDDYIRYSEWAARERARHLEAEREAFGRESDALRAQLEVALGDAGALREAFGRESDALRGQLEVALGLGDAGALREAFGRESGALRGQLEGLRGMVEALLNSRSLRITAPLRAAKRGFVVSAKRLHVAWIHLVRMLGQILQSIGRRAADHPTLRRLAQKLLARWPRLRWRVRRFLLRAPSASVMRLNADFLGPPLVATTPPKERVERFSRVERFAVIESMQAIVDVESLRARIRRRVEHR